MSPVGSGPAWARLPGMSVFSILCCPRPLPLTLSIPQDPLGGLEQELALQQQIAEAARRLSREESLGRQARRQRKQVALQEERKLRELQRRVGERRRNSEPADPRRPPVAGEP